MSENVKVLSNEYLKGVMTDAVVNRGRCSDINTCRQAGVYGITPMDTVNIPSQINGYGILKVEVSGVYGLQTICSRKAPMKVLMRTFMATNTDPDFSDWSMIQASLAT